MEGRSGDCAKVVTSSTASRYCTRSVVRSADAALLQLLAMLYYCLTRSLSRLSSGTTSAGAGTKIIARGLSGLSYFLRLRESLPSNTGHDLLRWVAGGYCLLRVSLC